MRSLLLAWIVAVVSFVAAPVHGARQAVLIGVSKYPSGTKPLPGAANDVELLRQTLLRQGFTEREIIVLSDVLAGALLPTRQNILDVLRRLAAHAQPGDYFFVHFSGHGSQQPVDPAVKTPRVESDGLHETFLPSDIGRWDGARATVTNAILDFELDAILQTLLDKGAFVWASFDACHAASLMRGLSDDEATLRHLDPEALGVPSALLEEAVRHANVSRGAGAAQDASEAPGGGGGFVAFYAAQTTQATPEMNLPRERLSLGTRRQRHGVFSYTLAEAMNARHGASYRELMQFILARYSAQNLSNIPTPVMSGTHPDAIVWGGEAQTGPRQWPIQRIGGQWRIAAGQLAQIGEGTQFAVVPDALAADAQRIGTMIASRVYPFHADLRFESADPSNTRLPAGAHARLLRHVFDRTLRVGLASVKRGGALAKPVAQAVEALREDPAYARLTWLESGEGADVHVHLEDQRLWLLPASGVLLKSGPHRTVSMALASDPQRTAERLGESLLRMAKTLALLRAAEQIPPSANSALQIRIEHLPGATNPSPRTLSPAAVERISDGSRIGFSLSNHARVPFDITLLYVDSRYGITPLFPGAGEDNRVMPGGVLTTAGGALAPIEINADTLGLERLLVIAVPVRAQGERVDFSYLAHPRLGRARGGENARSALQEVLEQAAFGDAARGTGRAGEGADAIVQVFAWEVVK